MAKKDQFFNRAAACEAHDDAPRSAETRETIGDVILRRFSRRAMPDRFDFKEIEAGVDTTHHIAEGCELGSGEAHGSWPLLP